MGGSGGNKTPNDPRTDQKGSGMGIVLRVKVIKGRNLAAKDKSGTSDPFLVLTLGDTKEATSVERKTLNPEWNQTFDIPVVSSDSALLEGVCWDKDRFRKDYMGEFDVMLEDVFNSMATASLEPQWIKLEGRRTSRKKKKNSDISGEVLLSFSLYDSTNPAATPQQIISKFYGVVVDTLDDDEEYEDALLSQIPSRGLGETSELDDYDDDRVPSDETDDGTRTPEGGSPDESSKNQRRRRIRKLKYKRKMKAYEFGGMSDVIGVLYLEISRITDLPPETNVTRTTFDMDPFVVTSLGKKTYRTRVVRHNLNPVYDEKMVFSVQKHEQNYSLNFAVVDRDNFSNNDYVGTANLAVEQIRALAPEADPDTGLYKLPDPDNVADGENRRRRWRVPLSRATSSASVSKLTRDNSTSNLAKLGSAALSTVRAASPIPGVRRQDSDNGSQELRPPPTSNPSYVSTNTTSGDSPTNAADAGLSVYELPLSLKNKQRWEAKHNPILYLRAKYLPYKALRQQFWRLMLRQYDVDESGTLSKVELVTMLDTLGSTLHDSTIDGFFNRWKNDNDGEETLTVDQAVICLEEQLLKSNDSQKHKFASQLKFKTPNLQIPHLGSTDSNSNVENLAQANANADDVKEVPTFKVKDHGAAGEEGEELPVDDLAQTESFDDHEFDNLMDDGNRDPTEEHVVEIQECPICHQPRRGRLTSDADIITHIATCASSDWRAVNNLVMAGFVTSSQAQRKWYSKVISKVSYGGYRLGANSANILVQDRTTGMINEERMSVYVRLGIRLLYKGLKSRDMEKKKVRKLLKSLSVKQGRKYDDPASASQIPGFIAFHQLDMTEVLQPTEKFKTFNEFFYRELKPDARPCSAPETSHIIVSPADCRSVVFNRLDDAQRIWVKGREFSVERLLGNAYPEDAKRYKNGAMGIFRLAPQDYHRFHIPVDGVLGEPKLIEGEYYTVNPMAIRSALDVYGENIRVCVPIDSVSHGRVMVICVGAMMVGSTVITRKKGEVVKRAEELGYFKFGGSTLLVLFSQGSMSFDDDLIDNSNDALETLIRVGMSVGRSPHVKPHTPDMKKSDPTVEEMQDAQRRIGGSLGPDGPSKKPSGMHMALRM